MKKIISMILAIAMVFSMAVPAFAAEDGYSCSDYMDCTADGSEIYIITKDGCPIREAPNNKGKIYARAEKGQLIAVKRVFWTKKMTRWCEIATDSGTPLYIYIENVTPEVHSFIPLLVNDNGSLEFCAICGLAKAEAGGKNSMCDFTCVADQAVKGSFSDYNPTFASIMAQIIAGEVLGPIADGRDLVADIMHGEAGWVIAMDLVALLPLIGALKYSDELMIVGKNGDEFAAGAKNAGNIAGAAKHSQNIFWGKWDDYEKVWENGKEYAQIGDYKYTQHAVSEFLNPSIETNQILKINPDTGRISRPEHSRGVPPSWVNWILTEGVDLGTTKVSPEYVDEATGALRRKFTNGTLEVVVEGDIVITIFTK